MAGKKITVKQIKSGLGRGKKQQATLVGLGLGKVGAERSLIDTPDVRGMIAKVTHLVEVQEG